MITKPEFLNNLIGRQVFIDKIISWSLKSIPCELLTSDTIILLPNISSPAYIDRANTIGYSPENIKTSYDRCNYTNLKLFNEHITKSVIFLTNNQCLVSDYLLDKSGDNSPITIIHNNCDEYSEILKWFDDMLNKSDVRL